MKKRKMMYVIGALLFLAAVAVAVWIWQRSAGDDSDNLALTKGVKATCDSAETEELSAEKAIDGDDETLSSRWSSENNWENASHYIELEFPEEISVSFVVLKWERTNVISYQLEGSVDGENWYVLESFKQAPAAKRQEIPLAEAATVKFLRLSTNAVSQTEEDYSNLYQNVSLYEFEVYSEKPLAYRLEEPEIVVRDDNGRYLKVPEVPEGYRITYLGADYEQVIGSDCEIYETIQDKEVTVGFSVERIDQAEEAEEITFTIQVPAAGNGLSGSNAAPEVIPAIAEWDGADGMFAPNEKSRVIVGQTSLMRTAELFAERYREITGYEISITEGTFKDAQAGDFYFGYTDGKENDDAMNAGFPDLDAAVAKGVGEEGYVCDITDKCVIIGTHEQGIHWGTITILQILKGDKDGIPQGRIRDYPKYQVRGFGIDVARKPVSMAMLYQIVENMSWYKMNDLCIHLNDNVILSTSGLTGSIEEAMTAESAFRIDSSVMNEKGEKLTSADYAYTTEEFAQFIKTAGTYGVRIVPEIDTPAHSLSITKLYPEYALTVRNEAVDQIDLSKKEAITLVKNIWRESLSGAFADASVVNIGMDEYYGDGETYRKYMKEMIELVYAESDVETVRLWGSLSNIEGNTAPPADKVQMNIWSTLWADPLTMYRQDYALINMQNNHLYIIPGGGYDHLDTEELYQNWEANKFYDYKQLEIIPVYSPQMAGAAYMIWNDMSGSLDVGISENDLFARFFQPIGVLSGKLWGESPSRDYSYTEWMALFDKLGYAPGSNPYAGAAGEDGPFMLVGEEETIALQGGNDHVETGYTGGNGNGFGIGGSYTVSMQVFREDPEDTQEAILFETDSAYGQTAFKAVQTGTGQVGFSREGRDYSFDYVLPTEEWVTLTIEGRLGQTSLYVNGKLIDTLGDEEPFTEYATFVFPLERIGSKTNGFRGMIKGVEVQSF